MFFFYFNFFVFSNVRVVWICSVWKFIKVEVFFVWERLWFKELNVVLWWSLRIDVCIVICCNFVRKFMLEWDIRREM